MKRGIVIGKFYPPHLGHKYLIDQAELNCDQLTVLVCDSPNYTLSVNLRAKWLKLIHPNVKVVIIDDIGQDDDSEAWAEHTINFLGYRPDIVFSSENYGIPYSKFMECEHAMIDFFRNHVNITGTKIRANLFGNWYYLHPIVQAHYAIRICVLGAESTGTTTLCKALAKHYNTNWVPEYGRMYSEGKLFYNNWESLEFNHIAMMQNLTEDQLAIGCNKVLICDTNAFATAIWHNRYMNYYDSSVYSPSMDRKYDLTILTGDEIPFVQDGLRDGEKIRHAMHNTFKIRLTEYELSHIIVTGSVEERTKIAVNKIDNIIRKFKF